jgi:hypothetical protein
VDAPNGDWKKCRYPGCGRTHAAKGLCAAHYRQEWDGRSLSPLRQRPSGKRVRLPGIAVDEATAKALEDEAPTLAEALRRIVTDWASRKRTRKTGKRLVELLR